MSGPWGASHTIWGLEGLAICCWQKWSSTIFPNHVEVSKHQGPRNIDPKLIRLLFLSGHLQEGPQYMEIGSFSHFGTKPD